MTNVPRTPTQLDRVADDWVDELVRLSPALATYIGREEGTDRYPDYSPDGIEEVATAVKRTRAAVAATEPVDVVDDITKLDLLRDLDTDIELNEAGWAYRDLNVLTSSIHEIRSIYDLMPTDTADDWAIISSRLRAVPGAVAGFRATLEEGIRRGTVPAVRQVSEVAVQLDRYAKTGGFFDEFAKRGGETVSANHATELHRAAREAAASFGEFSEFLRSTLAPAASVDDAVGREAYQLHSRRFLGATVDLDETYEWGIEELRRMVEQQEAVAREILPGASVAEAIAHLENDATRKLHGTEALQRWMQETSDHAVAELADVHFDVPEPIRRLECMIAPTREGGIYYTPPSADFARPGRMWWSVPEGVDTFDTWRELTTVYHEGVPGHHLQLGQQVYQSDTLNTWRRLFAGASGHLEGWALYAEKLMESLGYLDDPADRLGMLDGQRMRAARVVLDIGVHLGKQRPDGGGVWNADYALEFMRQNVNMPDEFVQFEVNRYLGWPGQAPSYKVGQRVWEELRDEVARREGEAFSLKEFHRRALAIGSVGLDTLRTAILD